MLAEGKLKYFLILVMMFIFARVSMAVSFESDGRVIPEERKQFGLDIKGAKDLNVGDSLAALPNLKSAFIFTGDAVIARKLTW